jgi:hypothetical protein
MRGRWRNWGRPRGRLGWGRVAGDEGACGGALGAISGTLDEGMGAGRRLAGGVTGTEGAVVALRAWEVRAAGGVMGGRLDGGRGVHRLFLGSGCARLGRTEAVKGIRDVRVGGGEQEGLRTLKRSAWVSKTRPIYEEGFVKPVAAVLLRRIPRTLPSPSASVGRVPTARLGPSSRSLRPVAPPPSRKPREVLSPAASWF